MDHKPTLTEYATRYNMVASTTYTELWYQVYIIYMTPGIQHALSSNIPRLCSTLGFHCDSVLCVFFSLLVLRRSGSTLGP